MEERIPSGPSVPVSIPYFIVEFRLLIPSGGKQATVSLPRCITSIIFTTEADHHCTSPVWISSAEYLHDAVLELFIVIDIEFHSGLRVDPFGLQSPN